MSAGSRRTPYSSSTICASSTRSSESMSSASKVASRVTSSGSGPKVEIASRTRVSICSVVTVLIRCVLSGGQAAVDCQGCSGDVCGLGRGQEADARGDLLGRSRPAGRHVLDGVVGDVAGELGLDEPGGDGVDGDVAPRDLG